MWAHDRIVVDGDTGYDAYSALVRTAAVCVCGPTRVDVAIACQVYSWICFHGSSLFGVIILLLVLHCLTFDMLVFDMLLFHVHYKLLYSVALLDGDLG